MKNLIIFLVIIVFCGCNNTDEDVLCAYYDTSISFSVLDGKSEDLLDPDNPNGLDLSKMKLFYEINGEVKEQQVGPNFSKVVFRNLVTNKFQINIPLNTSDLKKKTTTYIQWDEKDKDTLKTIFDTDNCFTGISQVWLNGELIFDGLYKEKVCTLIK